MRTCALGRNKGIAPVRAVSVLLLEMLPSLQAEINGEILSTKLFSLGVRAILLCRRRLPRLETVSSRCSGRQGAEGFGGEEAESAEGRVEPAPAEEPPRFRRGMRDPALGVQRRSLHL